MWKKCSVVSCACCYLMTSLTKTTPHWELFLWGGWHVAGHLPAPVYCGTRHEPQVAQGRLHARGHFFSWQLVILSALLQFEATALRHSRTSVVPSAAVEVSCEQQRWWDSHLPVWKRRAKETYEYSCHSCIDHVHWTKWTRSSEDQVLIM